MRDPKWEHQSWGNVAQRAFGGVNRDSIQFRGLYHWIPCNRQERTAWADLNGGPHFSARFSRGTNRAGIYAYALRDYAAQIDNTFDGAYCPIIGNATNRYEGYLQGPVGWPIVYSLWIKPIYFEWATQHATVFSTIGTATQLLIRGPGDGRRTLIFYNSAQGAAFDSYEPVNMGEWNHVMVVLAGTDAVHLYMNGKYQGSGVPNVSALSGLDGTQPTCILSHGAAGGGGLVGYFRDFRVYGPQCVTPDLLARHLYYPTTRYELWQRPGVESFLPAATQQINPSTTAFSFASPQPAIIPGEVAVSPQVTALTTAVEEPTIIFPLFLYPETVTMASAVPQPEVTVGPTAVAPQTVPLAFAPAQPTLQPGEVVVNPSLTNLLFLPQAPVLSAQAYIFAAARVLRRMLGLRRKIVRFGRYAMPNYDASINSIVSGDSLRVEAVVREVAANDYIIKAWLTIKAAETDPDISAVLQKVITTTQVAAVGQVADTGAADGVAHLEFDFLKTDTALLSPGVTYYYDIQCMTFGGGVFTLEKGSITTRRGITVSDT